MVYYRLEVPRYLDGVGRCGIEWTKKIGRDEKGLDLKHREAPRADDDEGDDRDDKRVQKPNRIHLTRRLSHYKVRRRRKENEDAINYELKMVLMLR